MQKFTQKEVDEIIERLEKMHPEAHCELNFDTPFEALVAIILSAQCTDKRVNLVTQDLYKKYNTPQQFASLDIKELEELIKPCGFYKNKAKNIKECAKQIIEEFNGVVPNTMDFSSIASSNNANHGRFNKTCWGWKKNCKCNACRNI